MQTWSLKPAPADPSQNAVANVIGSLGKDQFASLALGHLNAILTAGSWAAYRVWRDRPPLRYLSASYGIADTTQACFAIYRDEGLYRNDRSFAAVHSEQGMGGAVMLRMHSDDVPSSLHRQAIYVRHGVVERLSVARTEEDGSLLAVNLYHHHGQGRFTAAEIENFAQVAPALIAAVSRHAEMTAPCDRADGLRAALAQRCTALTARELDVLERLLQGMSYDGIAADLALSTATVKTYRARAFDRMGIHFKSELFAKFLS